MKPGYIRPTNTKLWMTNIHSAETKPSIQKTLRGLFTIQSGWRCAAL